LHIGLHITLFGIVTDVALDSKPAGCMLLTGCLLFVHILFLIKITPKPLSQVTYHGYGTATQFQTALVDETGKPEVGYTAHVC
jgi:hypothetical protein